MDCIVTLPTQLFYTTGIPVCLWFLTRDKTGNNLKHSGRDRRGETLFIDARRLGMMQTRTLRVLSDGSFGEDDLLPSCDIGRIVYAFRQWHGEAAPKWWNKNEHGHWKYQDVRGFCRSASLAEIAQNTFDLTPARYAGPGALTRRDQAGNGIARRVIARIRDLSEQVAEQLGCGPEIVTNGAVNRVPLGEVVDSVKEVIDRSAQPQTAFVLYSIPAYDAAQKVEHVLGGEIKSHKLRVPEHCILFSKLNPSTPRVWLVNKTPGDDRSICSTEFLVLRPKNPQLLWYLYGILRAPDFVHEAAAKATGSTGSRQRVRSTDVLAMHIEVPGPEVLAAFNRLCVPILNRTPRKAERCDLGVVRETAWP